MPEEQYRTALQRYRVWLIEAQEEVTRRRSALGPGDVCLVCEVASP
jgi:hypothetical protein